MPRVRIVDTEGVRDAVVGVLDRIPDPVFARLRDRYARTPPGGPVHRALTPLVAISRHRRLPVEEFALGGSPEIRLEGSDSLVAKLLYWYGADGYEGAEAVYWRRACASATNVLELGANIGYYTVQGATANPHCRYRTVEPHPASAAAVRRNVVRNGLRNVEVVEAAAVGRRGLGPMELSVPAQDRYALPAGAFLRDGGEGVAHLGERATVTVDTVAMEDLIDDVDLLKLDIEGHEADVLEPVLETLLRTGPTIFLEVRMAEVPRLRRMILQFARSGWVVFAIGSESLHLVTVDELEDDAGLPRYGSRDLVLVPADRVGDL